MTLRLLPTIVVTASAALTLAGCVPVVSMAPAAENANDPECAAATVRMPDAIGGYELRRTDAQATAAWGDPTVVVLYCGVPVPEVSDLPCVPIDGVYWLREEVPAGLAFTTYGRDPAIRVVVDVPEGTDEVTVGPGVVLAELADAVAFTSTNGRECLGMEDAMTGG